MTPRFGSVPAPDGACEDAPDPRCCPECGETKRTNARACRACLDVLAACPDCGGRKGPDYDRCDPCARRIRADAAALDIEGCAARLAELKGMSLAVARRAVWPTTREFTAGLEQRMGGER